MTDRDEDPDPDLGVKVWDESPDPDLCCRSLQFDIFIQPYAEWIQRSDQFKSIFKFLLVNLRDILIDHLLRHNVGYLLKFNVFDLNGIKEYKSLL